MSKLKVNIVSASEEIFSGEADMVFATGTLGEIGVAPGHSPLLTGLLPGPVRVASGSEEDTFFGSGGFIEVQPDVVTVLSDVAERAEDLDEAKALKAQEEAEQLAKEIASSAPMAVESIRSTLRGNLADQIEQIMDWELSEQVRLQKTEDFKTGIAASLSRETPQFKRK